MIDPRLIELVSSWYDDPTGWCYAASEALYYLAGGKAAGIKPMQAAIQIEGQRVSHWWLRDSDGSVVDVTAGQFPFRFPYERGVGRGFQTNMKADTREIIEWVKTQI